MVSRLYLEFKNMKTYLLKISVISVIFITFVFPGYAGIISVLNSIYSLDPNKHYSQEEIVDKWNKARKFMTSDYTYAEKKDNMGVYYVVTNLKDRYCEFRILKCPYCNGRGNCNACGSTGKYYAFGTKDNKGNIMYTKLMANGNSYVYSYNMYSNSTPSPYTPDYGSSSSSSESTKTSRICPYCNSGYHHRGGNVSTHSMKRCDKCGVEYDIFYTHTCVCKHCGGSGILTR